MEPGVFNEILVLSDDKSWVWLFLRKCMERNGQPFVKMPSDVPIRQSWQRFKNTERIIIHWESNRNGGAIIEEILDVSPHYDVSDRIIIVTTNPLREDVVYFSELGLRRIIRLRNRDKELRIASQELTSHIRTEGTQDKLELAWRKLQRAIDLVPTNAGEDRYDKLHSQLEKLMARSENPPARYYDGKACLLAKQEDYEKAEDYWRKALDVNQNYFRAYNNLIGLYNTTDRLSEAFELMKKMHQLNKQNISRLVDMGELHKTKGDVDRAQHYFNSALQRDAYCSRALNGMAEIHFYNGNLEESRSMLSKSSLAYQLARNLNLKGIELVRKQSYEDALEHYTKAQYVIPHQNKGPMLFYNIGLCYSRWGKHDMAKEFLKIALIKEPNYRKAQRLLQQIAESEPHAAA